MECLPTTDNLALVTLAVSIIVGAILAYHAYLFRRQSDGLWKSIEDASEKEKRQLRAYVYPTGKAEISQNQLFAGGHTRSFWVDIQISNTGKLPATSVSYEWNFGIIEKNKLTGKVIEGSQTHSIPHMGPHQSLFIVGATYLEESAFSNLSESITHYLAFWGVIRYYDGWASQESEFCFIYTTKSSVGGESMRAINPNNPEPKGKNPPKAA